MPSYSSTVSDRVCSVYPCHLANKRTLLLHDMSSLFRPKSEQQWLDRFESKGEVSSCRAAWTCMVCLNVEEAKFDLEAKGMLPFHAA